VLPSSTLFTVASFHSSVPKFSTFWWSHERPHSNPTPCHCHLHHLQRGRGMGGGLRLQTHHRAFIPNFYFQISISLVSIEKNKLRWLKCVSMVYEPPTLSVCLSLGLWPVKKYWNKTCSFLGPEAGACTANIFILVISKCAALSYRVCHSKSHEKSNFCCQI
jgi:hypothetical protein